MRKRILAVLLILSAFCFAACNANKSANARVSGGAKSVGDVLEEQMSEKKVVVFPVQNSEPESESEPVSEEASEETKNAQGDVDIDLTVMSSNMVYSQVYAMISNPDDYIGQTVRMNGLFTLLGDEVTGATYYGCIVQDATACCASGIEFVPAGDLKYPDDFPEEGEEITVTGTFSTYYEDEELYCTLKDSLIEKE